MLSELFSTNKRIQILNHVLYQENITVTTVSKELSLSKGFVSDYLSLLTKKKILKKNKKYSYIPNPLTRSIKTLLNIQKIDIKKIKKPYIKSIGIYGSWANGTNNIHSDLDIWIKTDTYPKEKELSQLTKNLREMVHTNVQLLVLTPNKIKQIQKDTPFYSSLYFGSLILWGDSFE